MFLIDNITDDTQQTQVVILEDGTSFEITLYFIPLQYMWVITSLVYGDFTLKNHRVCNSLNMLHQFKNKIPFGLACISAEDREPMLIDDFLEGSSELYLITEEEADQYGDYLSDG